MSEVLAQLEKKGGGDISFSNATLVGTLNACTRNSTIQLSETANTVIVFGVFDKGYGAITNIVGASAFFMGNTWNSANYASFCAIFENLNTNSLVMNWSGGSSYFWSVAVVKVD